MERFADNQQLDPFFKPLVKFCQQHGIKMTIVSDGLDFYIQKILKNHGLEGFLEVRANHLVFLDRDQIQPEFPYFVDGCGLCGNCKGFHVRAARKQGHEVVLHWRWVVGPLRRQRSGHRVCETTSGFADVLQGKQHTVP